MKEDLEMCWNVDITGLVVGLVASLLYIIGILHISVALLLVSAKFYSYFRNRKRKNNYEEHYNVIEKEPPEFLTNNTEKTLLINQGNSSSQMSYSPLLDTILVDKKTLEKYKKEQLLAILKHEEGHSKFHAIEAIYKILINVLYYGSLIIIGLSLESLMVGIPLIFILSILQSSLQNYLSNIREKKADIYSISKGYKEELLSFYNINEKTKTPSSITLFTSNYPSKNQRNIWFSDYVTFTTDS